MLSQEIAAEMGYLQRVFGMTLCDKVHRSEIRKARNVEPLIRINRSQLRWFGHVFRMSQNRLAKQVLLTTSTRKRPLGHPSTIWRDYIFDLARSRFGVHPVDNLILLLIVRRFGFS